MHINIIEIKNKGISYFDRIIFSKKTITYKIIRETGWTNDPTVSHLSFNSLKGRNLKANTLVIIGNRVFLWIILVILWSQKLSFGSVFLLNKKRKHKIS